MGGCQGKEASDKNKNAVQSRAKAAKTSTSTSTALKRPHDSPNRDDVFLQLTKEKMNHELSCQQLKHVESLLHQKTTAFEAMLALVKYLSQDMEAFSLPQLKSDLINMKSQLENAEVKIGALQKLEAELRREREKMAGEHHFEIAKMRLDHVTEIKKMAEKFNKDSNDHSSLNQTEESLTQNIEFINSQWKTKLEETEKKHLEEQEKKSRLHSEELQELHNEAQQQINLMQEAYEQKFHEIVSQYDSVKTQLTDEIEKLNLNLNEMKEEKVTKEMQMITNAEKMENEDTTYQTVILPYKYLEQEVESLNAVMELRNQEISQLRLLTRQMERQMEEIPKSRDVITRLEQKVENLEAIINLKADYEKNLSEKHQVLLRKFDKESKAKKRLSMNNDELAWRLSQTETACTPESHSTSPAPPSSAQRLPQDTKQRPKSMVVLGSPTGSTSPIQVKPPIGNKPTGMKLRKPRLFGAVTPTEEEETQLGPFHQSDV